MDSNSEKVCTKCKTRRKLNGFPNDSRMSCGKSSHCRSCNSKRNSERAKTPEGKIANRNKSKKYRQENPDKFKLGVKMSSYKKLGIKITVEQYKQLYQDQKGLCAICFLPPSSRKDLSLDHCHVTKKIRGFLCDNCNTALGKFKDSGLLLRSALTYLRKNG